MKSFADFEDMHRSDWQTGNTITQSSLESDYVLDSSWYYKGDENMTIWYSFDDDSDPEIAEIV